MNIQAAYNTWSATYDDVLNKTRDLEAVAIRQLLAEISFSEVIEIGCGTGKNTEWLAGKAATIIAVDFSTEMLAKAMAKITARNVRFHQVDIAHEWDFAVAPVDLVACSLILEHIQHLGFVFRQAAKALKPGGWFYIGELHPFKQYQGSKARFENGNSVFEVQCFTHHVSDFTAAAAQNGFNCAIISEWFDDNDRAAVPRILALVFQKQ